MKIVIHAHLSVELVHHTAATVFVRHSNTRDAETARPTAVFATTQAAVFPKTPLDAQIALVATACASLSRDAVKAHGMLFVSICASNTALSLVPLGVGMASVILPTKPVHRALPIVPLAYQRVAMVFATEMKPAAIVNPTAVFAVVPMVALRML
mgnify:CR=1 FL=1